jgi:predicted DNA-binding protein (MmcQ/YjbR family)
MRVAEFTPRELAYLERVRAVCLRLPDAEEAIKWGYPNFLARGKIFCGFGRESGVATVGLKTTPLRQAELVATGRYYVAPYVGRFGWVSHPLTGRIRWKELEELIEESYRLIVPRRGRPPAAMPSRRRRSRGAAR